MTLRALPFAVLVAVAATAARAEECSFADDLSQVLAVAKVAPGAPRLHFAEAPDKANGDCSAKRCPYVTPGDAVVVTAKAGAAACATFTGRDGRATTGWLPADRLAPAEPKAADWIGGWGGAERAITIRADGAGLAFEGKLRIQQGGPVFSGAFRGHAESPGAILSFATDAKGRPIAYDKAGEGACKVKLVLSGKALLVHDEGCVGLGSPVTFEGAYSRR